MTTQLKKVTVLLLILYSSSQLFAQNSQQILDFEFEGNTINGVLNYPINASPKGIVLIVHGSGQTNAVAQDWYADIRGTIAAAGYATYMWDKMGCGKSEGTFNYHQTVQNSAQEVIAAIQTLKKLEIEGSSKIGLWGVSRAGWINPLVINQYKNIQFWISVSGVDALENFGYLLYENLLIESYPKDSVALLVSEWKKGVAITHNGGSYEELMQASSNLQKDPFWLRFTNGGATKEGYYAYQKDFMNEKLDKATGLPIYVENFDSLLSQVSCPVLAIFGEKDKNVDWKKTKKLYQSTIAPSSNLTIKSFPDANHNLFECNTGGFYEFQDNQLPWIRPKGFLETMNQWLIQLD